jgi:hypothetical protein
MRILLPIEAREQLARDTASVQRIMGPFSRPKEIDRLIDKLRAQYPDCFHKDK